MSVIRVLSDPQEQSQTMFEWMDGQRKEELNGGPWYESS